MISEIAINYSKAKKVSSSPKREEIKDIESEFKTLIQTRIFRCVGSVIAARNNKKEISNYHNKCLFWDDKHFSVPVCDALEEALDQTIDQWSKLVWQQIVRLYVDYNYNSQLFQYATEKLLVL